MRKAPLLLSMKIFLTDQTKNFSRHLDELKKKSVMKYDKNRLKESISSIDLESYPSDIQILWDYLIFPSSIMSFLTEWSVDNRKMKVGDTIVQQVYIPPIRAFSQKVVFGVRISEIIDEPTRKGFIYETLEGHVEKGISTFTVEQANQSTIFKIQTYSTPGNMLTRLMGPIFSIPYQRFSTKRALLNVKRQIEKSTKAQHMQNPHG